MSVFRVAARRALPLVCASGVWLGPTPPAWADALWLDGSGRPLAAAHTVVDWLTHAERDGLQPADYGAADLARAVAAAQAQAPSADEAARLDTALTDAATRYLQQLRYLYIPHLGRSFAVVVMIETIFLLSVFAEIFTTTGGGPGDASTNIAFLIFKQALLNFDAGVASAGALFAVVLANIAGIFLIRMVGKNLDK